MLTTTYVGATEQKALDRLAELPNCEVRVSLDGRRTRLHAKAHFESLWEDNEFQPYDPDNLDHQRVLREALKRESGQPGPIANPTFFELQPKPFQEDILEQLETERSHGRNRNLLVAATGTGKTVMAAFDYRALARQEGGHPRLLFVAHRIEILQQALATYRQVLRAPDFGELLSGHHTPSAVRLRSASLSPTRTS